MELDQMDSFLLVSQLMIEPFFSYGSLLEPLIEKFTYLSNDDQIKSHVVLTRLLQKVEKKQKVFKFFLNTNIVYIA